MSPRSSLLGEESRTRGSGGNRAYILPVFMKNGWKNSQSYSAIQGSKKVPSGCPGQVDFPVRQVTFHSHSPGQAKFESYLSKGQAGIQVIFEPCYSVYLRCFKRQNSNLALLLIFKLLYSALSMIWPISKL